MHLLNLYCPLIVDDSPYSLTSCSPVQGSSPSVPEESNLNALGRSLSGSIQIVAGAVAGTQDTEQLDMLLARVDDSTAALALQEEASRSTPAPFGVQQLPAGLTPLNDTLTGRE